MQCEKGKRFILIQFTTLVLGLGGALSSHAKTPDDNSISSANRMAFKLIDTLPNSGLKKGLQRYYQILDPQSYVNDQEVAMSNSGLTNFFQVQFNKRQCFAEKALLFYRDVRNSTRASQKVNAQEGRHSRPSLGDTAGNSRKDIQAGWLFKKALKYSGGNPNAALTLIGMCGHDDQKQGNFENIEAEARLYNQGFTRQDLFFAKGDEDFEESPCPQQTSDFFISRSLSEKADISESLKKKILTVQYPGKRAVQIAAKNYHILGAAFMTCQMIEAGLNPYLAIKVETMAANIYRGIRLCQDIEIPAGLFWKLQNHPEIKSRAPHERFENAILRKALERGRSRVCLNKKVNADALCELLYRAGTPVDFSTREYEARALAVLQIYLDKMIASGLYSSWYINGEIAGISLPCSRDQLLGPHPFMKWLVSQANWPLNICGRGLSVETCRKALSTIKTWEVDFDWTVSQHKVGAEFAASVCKKYPQGQSSVNEFCRNTN